MYSPSPKAKRVEFRCPDPSCNPYLAFAAMLMAALDGIQNKIHPGEPLDKDIYDLAPEELAEVPKTPGSLDESLDALAKDHEFLLRGDVFTRRRDRHLDLLQAEERSRRDGPAAASVRVLLVLRHVIDANLVEPSLGRATDERRWSIASRIILAACVVHPASVVILAMYSHVDSLPGIVAEAEDEQYAADDDVDHRGVPGADDAQAAPQSSSPRAGYHR